MNDTILIVEDEVRLRFLLRDYLKKDGFTVLEASDGEEALNIFSQNNVNLIVLDVMMPKLDGLSAFSKIKEIKKIPTIILSARSEEYDKLVGFELGVDDYVTKPFSPKELMARIKVILKRKNGDDKFIYKDLKIDFLGHAVYIKDKELKLTPKEYDLLVYFVKNQNVALSREQLLNKIWDYDFYGEDRTVDTHIKMLRNNLGKYRDLIVTVRGMGYKFVTK